jgi:predicted nucleotidyltransferase
MKDRLQETRAILSQEQERLKQVYGITSIAIFGSVSRGEANEESDLDILVNMESPTFDRYMDLKFELEDRLGTTIDLVLMDALKDLMKDSIEREIVYV